MSKPWEIQPGAGAKILESLGKDVRLRARLGPPTAQLRAQAAESEAAAQTIAKRAARNLLAGDTAVTRNMLLNRLMVAEQRSLATTQIGGILLTHIQKLERKNYLEADPLEWRSHLAVRVTPLVPDTVFWKVDSGSRRRSERETRMLEVGEARQGRFTRTDSLISAPELGGQLTLMSGYSYLEGDHITVIGLVSPQTGEPQVDLDVLARPS
jgi:hypothetical protein